MQVFIIHSVIFSKYFSLFCYFGDLNDFYYSIYLSLHSQSSLVKFGNPFAEYPRCSSPLSSSIEGIPFVIWSVVLFCLTWWTAFASGWSWQWTNSEHWAFYWNCLFKQVVEYSNYLFFHVCTLWTYFMFLSLSLLFFIKYKTIKTKTKLHFFNAN